MKKVWYDLKDNIKNIKFHLDVQNAYYTAIITKK
jgi:hypothetical protein